jgi:mono/diheme cytochrome c family protein
MKTSRSVLLSALGASVLAVAALGGCRGWESDQPPVHLNWNMDTQEKGKAYRKSTMFKDGRAMRTPPAGTVAQGTLIEDTVKAVGQVEGEGGKLKVATAFPAGMSFGEAGLARGQQRYGIYCAPCHGASGDGDGPVNSRLAVKAPSFHDARLKEMAVGQMYSAILNGVNGGNMGSYAGQINVDDRWNVLAYVRAMQKARDPSVTLGGKPPPELPPPPTTPTAEFGKSLYAAKGCNACHSVDGSKLVGPTWKGVYGVSHKVSGADVVADDAYLIESIKNPMAKIVDGYPPAMPPYVMEEIELQSLVLFIQSLKN